MASLIEQGENFAASEVVLIDLDPERLELVQTLAQRMAHCRGLDLTVTATTDRRAGLADSDFVLTSYRPGGFAARYLDESIPLQFGVIGQETQGPGGFFMALRSIAVLQEIIADLEQVAPGATIVNYTNPVNIVAQAVGVNAGVPISLSARDRSTTRDSSCGRWDSIRSDSTFVRSGSTTPPGRCGTSTTARTSCPC